jgi:uncharacterized protein (DUF2267 family)
VQYQVVRAAEPPRRDAEAEPRHQKSLQQAVDRIVAIIKAEPDKERIDAIVTRWLKRHLQRLGAQLNLNELNSLMEDHNMLVQHPLSN